MASVDQGGSQGIVLPDGYVLLQVGDRFCLLDPDGVHLLIKPSNPDELHRIELFAWQHALDEIELRVRRDLRKFRAVTIPASEKLRRLREYRKLLDPRPAPPNTSRLGGRLRSEGVVALAAAAVVAIMFAAGQYVAPELPPSAYTPTTVSVEEGIVADYLRESAQSRRSIAVPARGGARTPIVPSSPERRSARSPFWPASPPRRAPALTAATVRKVGQATTPMRRAGPRAAPRHLVRVKRYKITVGVFAHPKAAQARAQVVRRKGYVARVVPVGARFRVEAGAYKSLTLAKEIAEAFRLFGLPAVLSAARPYSTAASTGGD